MSFEQMDDAQIWDAFRQGDIEAYMHIKQRFVAPLYRYGSKISSNPELAREVVTELFVNLWLKREKLGPAPSMSNYLYLSMRRNLLARIEKERRFTSMEDLAFDSLQDGQPSPEQSIITVERTAELESRLRSAISRLSNRQREAIHLRFFEERDYDEIARVMSMNTQSAYNLIHRALKVLREALGGTHSEILTISILLADLFKTLA